MRPGYDHYGCTCSTRDPFAEGHRELCPLYSAGLMTDAEEKARAADAILELERALKSARKAAREYHAEMVTWQTWASATDPREKGE